MKFLYSLCSLVLLAGVARTLVDSPGQSVFSTSRHGSLELTTVSSDHFTTFSHPAFPGRSARIKKSNFCDGNVASYTGYIDVGAKHLFFYFFESRNDPDNDDVLLWTNGGPGGSSSMGLFLELGPCNIVSPNSTEYNPYSWNSNANIFFIDQPTGTGFSYHEFGDIPSTTEEAGNDIARFIAAFFETFPKFKGRNFHLTGESYAGRFLPVYAAAVYDHNEVLVSNGFTPVNLKSVMIGNGATDFFYLVRSYYDMQCTAASVAPHSLNMCLKLPRCERWSKKACIDHFDLIDCNAAFKFCSEEMMPYLELGYSYYDMSKKCDTNTDCYPGQFDIVAYLDSPEVRKMLGVDHAFGNFTNIAMDVYDRFWASGDPLHQTQLYIPELLARGVKVLIYAGTYDFIANWVGNERWTLDMDWANKEAFAGSPLTEWFVNGEPAGKTRAYGNFTFTTIYGAGHLVPHDKPVESLEMLKRWLADKPM
ncbi:serine carboxypeptidase [Phellopilus nigrolimitatus]|nr:serine carboxypeptidase [Phellopilus nigrolimitatus]